MRVSGDHPALVIFALGLLPIGGADGPTQIGAVGEAIQRVGETLFILKLDD